MVCTRLFFALTNNLYMGSASRLRAIGQCRRRKTRCIFDIENPQKRCASCIRLDKECNFYRVGQPPQAVLEVHHGASGAWRLSPASRLNQLGRTSDAQNGLPYPIMGIQYLGSAELRNDNLASENRGQVHATESRNTFLEFQY